MRFLLKLKHWHLFAMTWGLPMIVDFFAFTKPDLLFAMLPFLMIPFVLGTFGWIWAIGTEFNTMLPSGVNLNSNRFKVIFSIPMIYIVLLIIITSQTTFFESNLMNLYPETIIAIILPLHLGSIIIIFWAMAFAAKTLKSIEIGGEATFSDYAGEFFLMWFSIIGYWILQPRINKLASNEYN